MGLARLNSSVKAVKNPACIEKSHAIAATASKHRRFVLISYEHGKGMGCQQSQSAAYAITPPRSFFARTGSRTSTTFSNNSGTASLTLQLPPSSKQWTWFFLSGAV